MSALMAVRGSGSKAKEHLDAGGNGPWRATACGRTVRNQEPIAWDSIDPRDYCCRCADIATQSATEVRP